MEAWVLLETWECCQHFEVISSKVDFDMKCTYLCICLKIISFMCKISLNKAILREWIISQKIYYWGHLFPPLFLTEVGFVLWFLDSANITGHLLYDKLPPMRGGCCQHGTQESCPGRAYSSREQTRRSLGITGRNNTVWIVSVNGGGCYFRWGQRWGRREISSETLAGQQSEWLQCKYISHKSVS